MNNLLKHYTNNFEFNMWLSAAEEMQWLILPLLADEYSLAEIKKGNLRYRIRKGILSVNASTATGISSDKFLTSRVLGMGLSYVTQPRRFAVDDLTDTEIESLLALHGKVVAKPVSENNGKGVITSLETLQDVKLAVQKIKDLGSRDILIENHVDVKKEFRVIIWKGKVVDIFERIPAHIIGNGKDTIDMLIQAKNHDKAEIAKVYKCLLTIDDDSLLCLEKQGFTLNSVPPEGTFIRLRNICNLSEGGEVKRIDVNTIHSDFLKVFEEVYKLTWLNYCGIDLICPDITQSPDSQQTVINELNAAPSLVMGYVAGFADNQVFEGVKRILHCMERDPVQALVPAQKV